VNELSVSKPDGPISQKEIANRDREAMHACLSEINVDRNTLFILAPGRGEAPVLDPLNNNLGFKIVDNKYGPTKILNLNIASDLFKAEGLTSPAKASIKIELLKFFSPDNKNLSKTVVII
jgi:hypothetical protein